jgi:predicted protein tyrosine phosphatase
MIKKISVLPRKEIERIINEKIIISHTWALISIYGEKELLTFSNQEVLKELNCQDFLSLQFHDITIEERKLVLFNEQHANWIINFLDDIKDKVDHLIVHCAAGISRSGAIGLFACRYFELDQKQFFKENFIMPNPHILKVLNKVSNKENEYIASWNNL